MTWKRDIIELAGRGALFAYGLGCFAVSYMIAAWNGYIVHPSTKSWLKLVEQERSRLWSLNSSLTYGGRACEHRFLRLHSGKRIHYLLGLPKSKPDSVIFFLHGWPDSCHLWEQVWDCLGNKPDGAAVEVSKTAWVALDLPGFGGSDSLQRYTAEQVLGALTESIIRIRKELLPQSSGKVVIAAHDWGGVCAWRLASQVGRDLADVFVITNAPEIRLAQRNMAKTVRSSWNNLLRFNIIGAAKAVAPALSQFVKSFYIFIFHLPPGLVSLAFWNGNHSFIRMVCRIAVTPSRLDSSSKGSNSAIEKAYTIQYASAMGPNEDCLLTRNKAGETYPQSVRTRTSSKAGHGAPSADAIRYYQEGLAFHRWVLSDETKALLAPLRKETKASIATAPKDSKAAAAAIRKQGRSLTPMSQTPVKFVWGAADQALDARIMLKDAGDDIGWENVVVLKTVGHWLPAEKGPGGRTGEGALVFSKCLVDALAQVKSG